MRISPHKNEPFSEDRDLDMRHIWATFRSWMEIDNHKRLRRGGKRKRHWGLLTKLFKLFGFCLKRIAFFELGKRNAYDVQFKKVECTFNDLPRSFDGYQILHLTDLHFDSLPNIEEILAALIGEVEVDLCVFTGDYRNEVHGPYRHIEQAMSKVVEAVHARDGILATLGNHDTVFMVNLIESMGVRVLANETVQIERGKERILITGIDDVHYYYTDMVHEAFASVADGFKIVLVHSPEVYDMAEQYGYRLYLTGHTHGGQISLPGGRPVLSHCNNGRHLSRGLWRHGGLTGYTSCGTSTSVIPIRFNTRGEITLITLKKNQ